MSSLEDKAKVAHDVWSHWMLYMFDQCIENKDGSMTIPAELVERWERQAITEYEDLTKKEQDSDLDIARKFFSRLG